MMNSAQVDYTGLRKRPTFEGIVDYLANEQEKTKYPDRQAKQIRNHPYLTQLDGVGMFEMQEQQENAWKEQEKERVMKELGISGKKDAGAQVQSVTNKEWDRMMENARMFISETSDSIKKGSNKVETDTQTRRPLPATESGSRNVVDDAMERELMFALRTIYRSGSRSSSSSQPPPAVHIIEQLSRGPPPPPGAAGAITVSDKGYNRAAMRALKMGFNAVYFGGKGSYKLMKFVHDFTKPVIIGLAEFMASVGR